MLKPRLIYGDFSIFQDGGRPDFYVAAFLLSSLPESYENLVTALDARPDDELTLEYVEGILIDEFKRRTENNDKSKTALRALNLK